MLATPAQASSLFLDELGRPQPQILQQVRSVAEKLPDNLRGPVLAAVSFFEGTGEGGVDLPDEAPGFTQFYWPSIGTNCIGGTQDALASAIAVPGPTEIPAPGAKEGETAFVLTALGTAPVVGEQALNVHWVNIDNFTFGTTKLEYNGINPEGPATLSGTAATGHGTVVAYIEGGITTEDAQCSFVPTAATFEVN